MMRSSPENRSASPSVRPRFAAFAIPLVFGSLLAVLQSLGPETVQLLRLEASAVHDGEWWRLLTANLIHLGWAHLGWNLGGIALLWFFCGDNLSARAWLLTLLVCLTGTGAGLLLNDPKLEWYLGFSGALHGLFAAGALVRLREGWWDGALVLVLLSSKLIYEQTIGPLPGVEQAVGGPVLVDAHLFGALSGIGAGILLIILAEIKKLRAAKQP